MANPTSCFHQVTTRSCRVETLGVVTAVAMLEVQPSKSSQREEVSGSELRAVELLVAVV